MKKHKCGACGAQLFSARFRDSGLLVHVEWLTLGPERFAGDIHIVPELPGVAMELPHVVRTATHRTNLREHHCPKAQRAHSARSFERKAR